MIVFLYHCIFQDLMIPRYVFSSETMALGTNPMFVYTYIKYDIKDIT